MQNKGNCGCDQGFIPVNGNWDFNMDRTCQQRSARRNNRRSACQTCNQEYVRERGDENCKCERCDDDRQAMCREQNTYIRDMDNCECERRCPRSRDRRCDECGEYQENNGSCCNECEERSCNDCNECEERSCNGCSECRERTGYRENNGSCRTGCGNGYNSDAYARQQNNGRPCKNRHVGMVSVEMQEIDSIYESETALRAGTLFPELHKPLNGYCPCEGNCGTRAQAAAFAAWEMRLYLNTHPHDTKALCFFRKLCQEAEEENYATTFLTDECGTSDWGWVENPWPWEYSCRCGDERPDCGCRNSNG